MRSYLDAIIDLKEQREIARDRAARSLKDTPDYFHWGKQANHLTTAIEYLEAQFQLDMAKDQPDVS